MPEWLQQSFQTVPPITVAQLIWRIGLAALFGFLVVGIYRGTHRDEPITPSFPRTLVLLSIIIAMVTQVIGESVARAFSLTGALAIVRFRTVVRDTQDTAFVIFAVVVGMAAGADHLWVAIVGSVIIGLVVLVLRPRRVTEGWADEECDLTVRVAVGLRPDEMMLAPFQKYVQTFEVLSVATAQKGSALETAYRLRLKPATRPFDMIRELNAIEGVQGVDLRRPEPT